MSKDKRVAYQVVCLALLSILACGRRNVMLPSAPAPLETTFIDLQPGWRLRAILPLWKAGTTADHDLTVQAADEKSRSVTLHPNENFLGYETQYYLLRRHWGALQIRFDSAAVVKDGVTSHLAIPSQDLFEIPGSVKRLRLVFLERASQADHDMALIAADQDRVLNDLTRRIQSNPESCEHLRVGYCSWIPQDVAVRAEVPVETETGIDWQPAR